MVTQIMFTLFTMARIFMQVSKASRLRKCRDQEVNKSYRFAVHCTLAFMKAAVRREQA